MVNRFRLPLVIFVMLFLALLTFTVSAQNNSGRETITVANAASLVETAALEGHAGAVNTVAFSPDGSLLASGGDDANVLLWDISTYEQNQVLSGHSSPVNSLAFSTDGTILAAGADMLHTAMLAWNAQTGQTVAEFDVCEALNQSQCDFVRSSAFSDDKPGRINEIVYMLNDLPEGQGMPFFGFGELGTQIFWFVENNAGEWLTGQGDFTTVVYSHNQDFRISGRSDGLWIYRTADAEETEEIIFSQAVLSLAINMDENLLAVASDDQKIQLFSVGVEGNEFITRDNGFLEGHTDSITSVDFSPDGTILVSSSLDGTVRLWDIATQTEIAVLSAPDGTEFRSLAFSPDGILIATAGSDGVVRFWGVGDDGAVVEEIIPQEGEWETESISFRQDTNVRLSFTVELDAEGNWEMVSNIISIQNTGNGIIAGTITFWDEALESDAGFSGELNLEGRRITISGQFVSPTEAQGTININDGLPAVEWTASP